MDWIPAQGRDDKKQGRDKKQSRDKKQGRDGKKQGRMTKNKARMTKKVGMKKQSWDNPAEGGARAPANDEGQIIGKTLTNRTVG
jgi:hypothetical protein